MNARRRLFALVIAGIAVSAAVGWVAGSRISSPAEVASRTTPPKASPILVPAESRVLSTDILTRGTARFGSPRQLILASSSLKIDAGVANRLPLASKELREGDVVLTTSGRPVFLLNGAQPSFRDLGPGATGEDVRQLEEALARMRFDPGPVDGVYDAMTERAVVEWYERSGFAAFSASREQLAALRTSEAARNSAQVEALSALGSAGKDQAALDAAHIARDAAIDAAGRSQRGVEAASAGARAGDDAARAEVAAKEGALAALAAPRLAIPATPAEITAAEAEVARAEAAADAARLAGEQAVADAVAAGAPAAIATARAQADANNRTAAAEVVAKRAALQVTRAGTRSAPATASEIAAATADVRTAKATAEATRLAGLRAVADADAAAATAAASVTKALGEVAAAETALDTSSAAVGVRNQQVDLSAADVSLARLRAGVQVPADEVIFVASTPVRVSEVVVAIGARATGPLMTVTDAVVAVDGAFRLEEARLAKAGMAVAIDEPSLGIKATGTIRRVADAPGTNGADGFHIYFEVLVDGAPPGLVGASVRMTVPIESSGGKVLAVPLGALTLSADGSSRVQREQSGSLEFVTVEPGLSANGFVAVKPLSGALAAGDMVVIGFDQQGALPK